MKTISGSNLSGNWLIAGSIPEFPNVLTNPNGIMVDFDVQGTTIVGSAAIQTTCTTTNPTLTFSTVLSAVIRGTVASDGTFTATSPAPSGLPVNTVLTVSGNVPTSADVAWAGTYTLALTGTCAITQTSTFQAVSIPDVTGTFTGTGMFTVPDQPQKTPLSINLTLQQGGPLYSPVNGAPATSSRLALDGSLQIQGITCFSRGTSSTSATNIIEGSRFHLTMAMDDGSSLLIEGDIVDQAVTQLAVTSLSVIGGQCNGFFGLTIPPIVLQR